MLHVDERASEGGKVPDCATSTSGTLRGEAVKVAAPKQGIDKDVEVLVFRSYLGELESLEGGLVVPAAFISFHNRHQALNPEL